MLFNYVLIWWTRTVSSRTCITQPSISQPTPLSHHSPPPPVHLQLFQSQNGANQHNYFISSFSMTDALNCPLELNSIQLLLTSPPIYLKLIRVDLQVTLPAPSANFLRDWVGAKPSLHRLTFSVRGSTYSLSVSESSERLRGYGRGSREKERKTRVKLFKWITVKKLVYMKHIEASTVNENVCISTHHY